MKKTIFTAIAIATMFVVSCNSNGTDNAVPNTDSTKNVVDSTHVVDTDSTHVITIDTSHCAD
jgi:PBP1b-binding outer membrane lipoprotein LpoB